MDVSPTSPKRVLHVVESLDRGAVENWLLRMLAYARRKSIEVDWTFYCAVATPGSIENQVRALNAHIVRSPVPLRLKRSFIRALRNELRQGKYAVLHCHHDLLSAAYLLAAAGLPINHRIVHVHNADEGVPTPSRFKRYLYREPMRRVCLRMADRIVGISNHTLDSFLAGCSRKPKRDSVHYYGIDAASFERTVSDRDRFRQTCELPNDALVLLFGGRLVPEKNPLFAVDVLASLRRREPRVFGVFAGTGSQEQPILERARELNIENSVRLVGWRNDLPEVMSCSDWFILPHPEHPMEGFGLAVVEAQLAGLRMLLSRGIADDPLLPTAVFRRLSLNDGPDAWADGALELLHEPAPSRAAAIEALTKSQMNMDHALNGLLQLYS